MQNELNVRQLSADVDPEGSLLELQRLILSYQAASPDDRNVVWAVLNKYAKYVDGLSEMPLPRVFSGAPNK